MYQKQKSVWRPTMLFEKRPKEALVKSIDTVAIANIRSLRLADRIGNP